MSESVRLLHVDDDPALLDVAATLIEHRHDEVSVTSVNRAERALMLLDSRAFDCVVSDYRMPKMDGLQLCHAICELYPELPFILFTNVPYTDLDRSIPQESYLEKSGLDQFEAVVKRATQLVDEVTVDCSGHSATAGP